MQTIPWPFIATEALAANALTFRELRRFHAAVYPGVWAPRGVEISAVDRARAAWLWSGRRGVVAGLSASAVLGAKWIDADTPAELVYSNRRPPARITAYADKLLPGEVQAIAGLLVTTPARTAFDIGRRLDFTSAVQRIDALMNATDVKVDDVRAVMAAHPGVRGLRQLRHVLEVVDGGSESPYESLTRLLLIRNGFPRPQTQIRVTDERWIRGGQARHGMAGMARGRRLRRGSPLDRSQAAPRTSNAMPSCQSWGGSTSESVATCCTTIRIWCSNAPGPRFLLEGVHERGECAISSAIRRRVAYETAQSAGDQSGRQSSVQPVRDGGESGVALRCNTARPGTTTSGDSSEAKDPRPSTIRLYPPGSAGGHTSVTSACARGIAAGAAARLAHLEAAVGQHGVHGHRMRAKIVADSDQVGKREVGQRLCELVQVDRDTHDAGAPGGRGPACPAGPTSAHRSRRSPRRRRWSPRSRRRSGRADGLRRAGRGRSPACAG